MANFKDQEEAHKEKYELRIKELETENKHLKSAERVPVVMSCSHEEEISQLQVCNFFFSFKIFKYHKYFMSGLDGAGVKKSKQKNNRRRIDF